MRGAPAGAGALRAATARELRDTARRRPGPGAAAAARASCSPATARSARGCCYDATRLIGRDDDVRRAARRRSAPSRVTSIVGAGGLGKTRLAHVMGRLAEQPVVHFVELAGVTSPDGVAVEVGSALGVRESRDRRRLPRPRASGPTCTPASSSRSGTRPTLLILDNCEHVVEAVADLVAVLVAARARAAGAHHHPGAARARRRAGLPAAAARAATTRVELFRERATAARPGVRLDDERVAPLVDRLDGLPLAVELAAAKVRVMSVEEIERRLENRFALLRGGSRDAPERHQTLLAVIDWSWNLLDEDERVALRRLSVFRDGFSLDGGRGGRSGADDALGAVAGLVDQSLVTVHEGADAALPAAGDGARVRPDAAGRRRRRRRGRARGCATGRSVRAAQSARRLFSPARSPRCGVRAEEGNLIDVLRGAPRRRRRRAPSCR